jgi:hypothetical protein
MKKINIAILTLLVAIAACKKVPEVNLKYVDVERDLITVGTTTATVQCDYQYIATLKKAYLYYGEGEDAADMNAAEMRVVQNTLYVDLAGLRANTTYSYYYEFHNGFNSMRTALKTFKTEAGNGGGDEPPIPPEIMLPTVITAMVTEITTNSAQCGGEVVNDGGAEVTERGICWSTNENPTLSDSHLAAGMGTGVYTAAMGGLEANTTYHVRAYATNSMGTAYGMDKEFVTLSGGGGGGSGDVPTGAINGLFTINDNGDQVYFSQGNLQYNKSTAVWSFMEHQFDMVETGYVGTNYANQNIVSWFGWGTSGWNNGNMYYQPYNTETFWDSESGYGYGPGDGTNYTYDLTGTYANADWGVYNAITNGGNMSNQWRVLTHPEWAYVFRTRTTPSGIRYAKGIVNGVNGIILLPDDWNASIYALNYTNKSDAPYSTNIITLANWEIMETYGAVFLPAAGYRELASTESVGSVGYYWSSSSHSSLNAYRLEFSNSFYSSGSSYRRFLGYSVRLVQDANL